MTPDLAAGLAAALTRSIPTLPCVLLDVRGEAGLAQIVTKAWVLLREKSPAATGEPSLGFFAGAEAHAALLEGLKRAWRAERQRLLQRSPFPTLISCCEPDWDGVQPLGLPFEVCPGLRREMILTPRSNLSFLTWPPFHDAAQAVVVINIGSSEETKP